MMMKIWQRYILSEAFRLFLFIVGTIYLLYALIDYSTHAQDFLSGSRPSIRHILLYYLAHFIKRADIILPLAILIASIKVLTHVRIHKELVALQSAAVAAKRVLKPLFLLSSLCTLILLAINEYALPKSLNFIDTFYDGHLRHSYRGKRGEPLHVFQLADHSKLAYQHYDASQEAFFDVLWIRSCDELWRMKYLKADPDYPLGQYVDHIERTTEGELEKTSSYRQLFFNELCWDPDMPRQGFIPYENRSITKLFDFLKQEKRINTPDTSEIVTQLLFKLCMPLLPFLAIIGIAPYCLRNETPLSPYLIYTLALFGYVTFIALMDAAVILGESQTISPVLAMLSPFIVLGGIFGWKLARAE